MDSYYFTFILLLTVWTSFVSGTKDAEFNVESRIIGGKEVDISKAPYMVSLQYLIKNAVWGHNCGGSIIAPTLVLTAAHCCEKTHRVKAGETTWAGNGGVTSQISHYVVHENFKKDSYSFDVGIVFLKSKLPIGGNIQILVLSTDAFVPDHSIAFVSGWGGNDCDEGMLSPVLKGLSVTVLPQSKCHARLKEYFHAGDNICAGKRDIKDISDIYIGDSGDPLVYNGKQIGIVSKGLCKLRHPRSASVYANVGYHRQWIRKQSGV